MRCACSSPMSQLQLDLLKMTNHDALQAQAVTDRTLADRRPDRRMTDFDMWTSASLVNPQPKESGEREVGAASTRGESKSRDPSRFINSDQIKLDQTIFNIPIMEAIASTSFTGQFFLRPSSSLWIAIRRSLGH